MFKFFGSLALVAAMVLSPVMFWQGVNNPPYVMYVTGSAYTNATTGFTSVPGLTFPVAANTNYHVVCRITWQGSAGTTGPKYQFTGPTVTADVVGMNSVVTATTVIEASTKGTTSPYGPVANSGTVTTATDFTDTVDLGLVVGATAGTVAFQAAANGAGTLTIEVGSHCLFQ